MTIFADTVQPNWERQRFFGRTAKAVLSGFLVLQMLALLALAASPALHHALHADSNSPNHHCLVTTLAKGQVGGTGMTPVVAPAVVFVICAAALPGVLPPSVFQYHFAPSRAPPRA